MLLHGLISPDKRENDKANMEVESLAPGSGDDSEPTGEEDFMFMNKREYLRKWGFIN